jgi:N-carbamoylputrescine amidase
VDPRGRVLGRAHKTFTEYACFAPGAPSSHVIQTAFGPVGVGICADNHRTAMLRLFQRERVALVLMPHAWPLPAHTNVLVSEGDVVRQTREADEWAKLYALRLGVPAAMVNQVGPLGGRWDGVVGWLFDPAVFRFGGHSSIAAADGTVLCRLGAEEGVMLADVTLDPSRRSTIAPPDHLGYVTPAGGAALFRHLVVPLAALAGKVRYRVSSERRRAAECSPSGR